MKQTITLALIGLISACGQVDPGPDIPNQPQGVPKQVEVDKY